MVSTESEVPKALDIDLGFTAVVRVMVAPITTLELTPPTKGGTIKELRTQVPMNGTYTGFTTREVSATLTWEIYSGDARAEYPTTGVIVLDGQGKFAFKVGGQDPILDVAMHGLFGVGSVGYRITPNYPHAPSTALSADQTHITFNNNFDVSIDKVQAPVIGTPIGLSLVHGAQVDKLLDGPDLYEASLSIDEVDDMKVEWRSPDNLHTEGGWTGATKGRELIWLAGCELPCGPEAPKLSYPEANETGVYEFSSRVSLGIPKQKKVVAVSGWQAIARIARPKITNFSLTYSFPEHEFAEYLYSSPIIAAEGTVVGFHHKLQVQVAVTLWRWSAAKQFVTVSGPFYTPLRDGRFRTVLYAFAAATGVTIADPLATWLRSIKATKDDSQPYLFATVRLAEQQLSKAKLPVVASLDFDAEQFKGFSEPLGVMTYQSLANAICSDEARQGFGVVTRVLGTLDSHDHGQSVPGPYKAY